ncbi:MAG: DUF3568 family protein [Desulfonatronovibrio sp.]
MYNLKQKICAFIILTLCLGLSGCWFALGGAAGGGTALYFKGRLQENIGRNMHTVHEAARNALNSLEIEISKEEKKVDSTSLEGKYRDGTNVWISTKYLSANSTQVTIRVGFIGDESRSRQIWDQIRRNL